MTKKTFTLFGAMAISLAVVPSLTACGNKQGEQIDTSKTTIFVNNFCRGFGGEWLTSYKKDFEALHANDSYETGKKGVQVFISNARGPAVETMDTINSGRDEIYFTEQSDFFTMKNAGVLHDITDVVTDKISGESKSIYDKMTEGQRNYLNFENKYYAIPHYSGYFGLTYDKDLFDAKNLYFNKDRNDFIIDSSEEKSVGPDGIAGTEDDGLPITYDEFFQLCEFMQKTCHITPMNICGQTGGYLNLLINNLTINDLGYEQSNLIYTCDGTVKDCVEIVDGEVSDLGDLPVTPKTGYNVYKSRARYNALKWYETMNSSNSDERKVRYTLDKMDSSAYSAGLCQLDFLSSNIPGAVASDFQPIGMIADGSWWVNEAGGTFDELSQIYGDKYSAKNRNLMFMPLPTSEEKEVKQNVLFDHLSALCFMKATIEEWKYPLLKEFMQFCNSDKALVDFSVITNSTKALQYEIPADSLAKMTPYGRSLYQVQNKSKIVYPYNGSTYFRNNSTFYKYENQNYSILGGLNNQYVINGFKNMKYNAEQYFKGMVDYYTQDWVNRTFVD